MNNETEFDKQRRQMKETYERMIQRLNQIATNVKVTPDTAPKPVHIIVEDDTPSPDDTQPIDPLVIEEDDDGKA